MLWLSGATPVADRLAEHGLCQRNLHDELVGLRHQPDGAHIFFHSRRVRPKRIGAALASSPPSASMLVVVRLEGGPPGALDADVAGLALSD